MKDGVKPGADLLREKAEEIFCVALELEHEDELLSLLNEHCGEDLSLRAEVNRMLAVQREVGQLFEGASPALAPDDFKFQELFGLGKPVEARPGMRIDRYKLLEAIGEGGCGVVYLAEQERPLRRQVALKVIKLGMDTKNVIARFESERQALAMMDHPHIAKVLDAGATGSGRPYFVMELVRGPRITEYCDRNNLNTKERLELFVQTCQAIQHAHQKGVIHRDIKPSNILITLHDGRPMPKVIDFGIAKAMDEPLTEKTMFTSSSQLIGTPAYMSPEQAAMSCLDVDTRSDIYSLGVLLYELLTGKTPFDQKELLSSGWDEMRRTLRETQPHRPSTKLETLQKTELTAMAGRRRVEPPQLQSLLRGDLDWIVMKALEKERERRYETVNALAMDVRRHLNSEPVLARPPSRLYRFQKLVRRNKAVFFSGCCVVLALAAGLGVSAHLFFREKAARQEAQRAQANELLLRQHAEIRETITRATVLLGRGEMAAADKLVAEIPDFLCPPYMEAVRVYRELADWNAVAGRWREAAQRAGAAVRLNRVDVTDQTGAVTCDYLGAAAALLQIGEIETYALLCREGRARFATTTSSVAAEQIVKVSLLAPAQPEALISLDPLVAVALTEIGGRPPTNPTTQQAWGAMALALNEYRRGNWEQSASWSLTALKPQDAPARTATSRVLLAMAYQQLGRLNEARELLQEARKLIENRFSKPLGVGALDTWHSWVMARLLLHEATGPIETAAPPR